MRSAVEVGRPVARLPLSVASALVLAACGETTRPASSMTFLSVSAGFNHSCGVVKGGTAYCWGDNDLGQLGNGTIARSRIPTAVSGGLSFAVVGAGFFYHTCGLTAGGAAYCWGDNVFGQLGNSSRPGSSTPVAVSGGLT